MAKGTDDKKRTDVADEVVKRFTASWSYAQQNHHQRWERNYKLYNNKRVSPSYQGTTNTFIALPYSMVETATATLTSGRPSIDFVPQDMYSYVYHYAATGEKPNLKALNSLFDYYWDCDNWDLKTIKTVRGGFLYDIAGEWIYWDGDKPRIINLGPRDIIVDPNITDPLQLITDPDNTYAGRRYLTSIGKLKSERIVDPDNPGKTKLRFKNLSQVTPGGGDGQTDKEQKEMFLGSTGSREDLVEVIEIWDGKRIRSVANRQIDIEDRDNPLGIIPLGLTRFVTDESLVYGKALLDPIAEQMEYLIDLANMRSDAIMDSILPQWELDPSQDDRIDLVTNAPGTVYPWAPGTLKQVDKDSVDFSAFREADNMKNEIREVVGIDQIVQGVGEDSNATATEINAQMGQAGQRFSLFVRMLEREGLYMRAKIVYQMMLHYQTQMTLVPTNTMDGPKFYQLDPSQFDDTFEPRIQLESNVKNKKRAEQSEALESFQAMIADPTNDLWEVKKILYPKMFDLNEEELDRIIGNQKPQEPMGLDPMAGGGEMPGEMPLDVPEMPLEGEVVA